MSKPEPVTPAQPGFVHGHRIELDLSHRIELDLSYLRDQPEQLSA